MKLIDDLAEVVRSAPIIAIDPAFLTKMNPTKAYEGLEMRPEYKSLIQSMLMMYDDATQRGIPRERAVAVVLGTHEEMVRYVVTKAIKDRMRAMNITDISTLEGQQQLGLVNESIKRAQTDLATIEGEVQKKASSQSIDIFKHSLQYAADKWGTPKEKKTVESLIKKITIT